MRRAIGGCHFRKSTTRINLSFNFSWQEYKKPLECSHPAMLSHSKISTVFHRVPEILQCHSLFRIALAEYIRKWDTDEKIGDVFVASFSKSLVLDVYSEFINNFGQAMETAKSEARRKSAFAEFLKVKQMTAHDRLSLFGLMVKPVQRFPQFILLLQVKCLKNFLSSQNLTDFLNRIY
jgi:Rho guanine nucleotide exchange factor 10